MVRQLAALLLNFLCIFKVLAGRALGRAISTFSIVVVCVQAAGEMGCSLTR